MLFCISIYRLKHTKFIDMVHMRNEISVLRSITPKNFSCLKWRKSEFPCSTHLPASFYFPEYLAFSCWVSFIFAKKNHKITGHRLSSLSRSFRRLYRSFRFPTLVSCMTSDLSATIFLTNIIVLLHNDYIFPFFLNCPISFITLHDLRTQTQFCNHWSHRL